MPASKHINNTLFANLGWAHFGWFEMGWRPANSINGNATSAKRQVHRSANLLILRQRSEHYDDGIANATVAQAQK